ncbi:reverse transcriptase domain-containing protein [Tanacetum coccineum]
MADSTCPRNEKKKLEADLWYLKVKSGTGEMKEYAELFHVGATGSKRAPNNRPCILKCVNCKKGCHMTRDCRNPAAARNQRNLTCYEYGNQGHYRSDCPELKNQTHGNQAEGTKARGMVYALGGGDTDQNPNNIEDETEALFFFKKNVSSLCLVNPSWN